jgi:hypothetical protein
MQSLSGSKLLDLWERGTGLHLLDRALLALSAALPEVPANHLADWPLGHRNRALMQLHRACFGARLQAWASCARCGEKMEFELDGQTLVEQGSDESAGDGIVRVNGQSFRLPSSRDLACVAEEKDSKTAVIRLLECCRIEGGACPTWSDEEVQAIEKSMAIGDPLAELQIALRCPECSHQWTASLELVTFLWAEIECRAKRLLWEIHALASAYGWTQSEILALSPARRASYLEMVRA